MHKHLIKNTMHIQLKPLRVLKLLRILKAMQLLGYEARVLQTTAHWNEH